MSELDYLKDAAQVFYYLSLSISGPLALFGYLRAKKKEQQEPESEKGSGVEEEEARMQRKSTPKKIRGREKRKAVSEEEEEEEEPPLTKKARTSKALADESLLEEAQNYRVGTQVSVFFIHL